VIFPPEEFPIKKRFVPILVQTTPPNLKKITRADIYGHPVIMLALLEKYQQKQSENISTVFAIHPPVKTGGILANR